VSESLTFTIYPDTEYVSFQLLQRTLGRIHRLVERVDYVVTREKAGRQWIVSDLHSSAPTITIEPLIDPQNVVDKVTDGLRIVSAGQAVVPPPFYSVDALRDVRSMQGLFTSKERLRRVEFRADAQTPPVATIDKTIGEKVDRILRRSYAILGSIEGQLDAVSFHGTSMFIIWDRLSGLPIRCYFPNNPLWKDRVKQLLERPVLVVGTVRYFSNGAPQTITEITELRDLSRDPKAREATFGSIPNYITGGRDSVEYVHSLREH
jgi:hypothetical protein